MGIATLIIATACSCTYKPNSSDMQYQEESTKSIIMSYEYLSEEWADSCYATVFSFDNVQDIVYYTGIKKFCIEYWDDDAFDAEDLQYHGYKIDPKNPYIRVWINPIEASTFIDEYKAYQKADVSTRYKLNDEWDLVCKDSKFYSVSHVIEPF